MQIIRRGRLPAQPPPRGRKSGARPYEIRSPYITISCGHTTTRETQERYRVWAPRARYWCDNCGKWLPQKIQDVVPDLPDRPMF